MHRTKRWLTLLNKSVVGGTFVSLYPIITKVLLVELLSTDVV